jgi:hypothetical protein
MSGMGRETPVWRIEAPEEAPPALEHEDTITAQTKVATSQAHRISPVTLCGATYSTVA